MLFPSDVKARLENMVIRQIVRNPTQNVVALVRQTDFFARARRTLRRPQLTYLFDMGKYFFDSHADKPQKKKGTKKGGPEGPPFEDYSKKYFVPRALPS